jgi:hypothetical protein
MLKHLKRGPVSLVLALLIAGAALATGPDCPDAHAATSTTWKRCGTVNWAGGERLLVEASELRCQTALEVARTLVGKMRRGQCENARYCTAKGFACPISGPRGSGSLLCHRDQARVRLRAPRD